MSKLQFRHTHGMKIRRMRETGVSRYICFTWEKSMTIQCPYCGKTLNVKPESAGKKGRCPACQQIIEIPRAEEAQPAPPAAPVSRDMEESTNADRAETAASQAESGAEMPSTQDRNKALEGAAAFRSVVFAGLCRKQSAGLMLYSALREYVLSPSPLRRNILAQGIRV